MITLNEISNNNAAKAPAYGIREVIVTIVYREQKWYVATDLLKYAIFI
jgi:hypothetical protein